MPDYEKYAISLKYWLLGKEFFLAVKAMEYAKKNHTGMRKDGTTPYFYHPVTVTNYLRPFERLMIAPETAFAAALLHDVVEDCNPSINDVEKEFGKEIADCVFLLSKETGYVNGYYYDRMAKNPVASIVKGADRIHNIQSMVGVFTEEKQKSYIEETREYTLPMIKEARTLFPEQEGIYENIKLVLNSQIALIESIHNSHNENLKVLNLL